METEDQGTSDQVSEKEVLESIGVTDESGSQESDGKDAGGDLPEYAKKRLGMQEKRHKKELREMQAQLQALHSRIGTQAGNTEQPTNPYGEQIESGSPEEYIHKAVSHALRAQEEQKRKAEEAEKMAHVHKQYQSLQEKMDGASEHYDDFDDVVRHPEAPYTTTMHDTALLLPNAEHVLYKLGKNRDELSRIARLHPLEQAKEMVKLSHALMSDASTKASSGSRPIMGQIKNTPVSSNSSVTDKTPVSELRRKMKNGWK